MQNVLGDETHRKKEKNKRKRTKALRVMVDTRVSRLGPPCPLIIRDAERDGNREIRFLSIERKKRRIKDDTGRRRRRRGGEAEGQSRADIKRRRRRNADDTKSSGSLAMDQTASGVS
jgi:hypothetical protein